MEPESDDLISFCSGPESSLEADVNSCPTESEKDGPTSFGEGVMEPLPILHELKDPKLETDEKQMEPIAGPETNALDSSSPFIEGKPLPPLHEWEDLEFEKLSQLCLPRWDSREVWRTESSAIRPERFEYTAMLGRPPSQAWKRAMQQLHSGFCHGRRLEEIMSFSQPSISKPFFGAVSIIVYDIQLQKGSQGDTHPNVKLQGQYHSKMSTWRDLMCLVGKSNIDFDRTARSIFQHMLLVDYGMVAHPVRVERFFDDQGRPTGDAWKRDWPIWHTICAVVSEMAQSCAQVEPDKFIIRSASNWFWRLSFLSPARSYIGARSHYEYDLALMLHHYHTRPTYLQPQEYWKGQTGYQGILQELIEDVPRVGTERLMRKLSVDLNENIDKFVADPAKGKTMKQIAKGIAARYGIELVAPKTRGLGTPLIELYYRNGVLKKEEKEEYPCSVQ